MANSVVVLLLLAFCVQKRSWALLPISKVVTGPMSKANFNLRTSTCGPAVKKCALLRDVCTRSMLKPSNPYKIIAPLAYCFLGSTSILALATWSMSHAVNIGPAILFYSINMVLGSAYDRNCLNGSTFKMINLGCLLSALFIAFVTIFNTSGGGLAELSTLQLAYFTITCFAGANSGIILNRNGWPSVYKLKINGLKGACPFTSSAYIVAGILSVWSAVNMKSWSVLVPTGPSIAVNVFLGPLALVTLHQATLGRSLNNATYRSMNYAVIANAAASLGCFMLAKYSSVSAAVVPPLNSLFVKSNLAVIAAGSLGLRVGNTQE